MNRLPIETGAKIISLLVEGMSMRSISRHIGCSINTVTKLLEEVGFACNMYQSENLRNLNCKRIQCDEIWGILLLERKERCTRRQEHSWAWRCMDLDGHRRRFRADGVLLGGQA